MKKILIFAVLAIMAVGTADAQIKVTSKSKGSEKIASVRGGLVNIYQYPDGRTFLSLPTSNQFDENLLIWLGADHASAILTMEGIVGLFDMGNNESVTIQDKLERSFTVDKAGSPGKGTLMFRSHEGIQVGYCTIHKIEANNLLKKMR